MRILHVILTLSERWGGPTKGLVTLARGQAERGDHVTIMPCRRDRDRAVLDSGTYGNLTVLPPVVRSRLLWFSPTLKRALRSEARRQDIFHLHSGNRYYTIGAASAAREAGIPYVMRPAGIWGRVARRHKLFLKKPYFLLFEKRAADLADGIHCCSRKEWSELSDLGIASRCFIVPQPLDFDLLGQEHDPGSIQEICPSLADGDPLILYLGRISWIKRIPMLLEAFASLHETVPRCRLVIAGPAEDRDLEAEIHATVRRSNLQDKVFLPGFVRGRAKASLLRRATILVQPSLHENFGVSVAEALMFGKPCVATVGVAISEEIERVGAGIRCGETSDSLKEALLELLKDPEMMERCSKQAVILAEQYHPLKVAESLEGEYLKCGARSDP